MKLNEMQRQERKNLKKLLGKRLILKITNRVTIAFEKTGPNRGKVAWAIHSTDDGKAHRKYGELVALDRLYYGYALPIEFHDADDLDKKLYVLSYWAARRN